MSRRPRNLNLPPASRRIHWTPDKIMPWRQDPTPEQRERLRAGIAAFRVMLEARAPKE